MHKKQQAIVLLNTITLVITLFSNFLAGSGLLINKTVGEVSNKYDTLFTPAGYAFGIWSLIFLLAIGFCIYQWYLLKKGDDKDYISRTGYWFALSNVANVLWLVCWINEWLALSVIVILFLLFCLCNLVVRLRLKLEDEPVKTLLLVNWPITIYLGWIMVATIANVAAWLVSAGFTGGVLGEETWAVVMVIIAAALFVLLLRIRKVTAALFVGIWSFVAIAVKQWYLHDYISRVAIIASIVLLVALIIQGFQRRPSRTLVNNRV